MSKKRWTAGQVHGLLAQRFPPPAFVLLQQVRNGTGYARKERYADAVAVSTYPSRGVYLTGIEIKVSRGDWRKELSEPDKAHAIEKYCRYWYLAAPKGIIPIDEMPFGWGLLECSGNSIAATLAPAATKETPPDMLLVASLLRSAAKAMISRSDHREAIEQARASDKETQAEAARLVTVEHELHRLKLSVAAFEKSSGISLARSWQSGDIGDAVRSILANTSPDAKRNKDTLVRVAKHILAQLDVEAAEAST